MVVPLLDSTVLVVLVVVLVLAVVVVGDEGESGLLYGLAPLVLKAAK